jgi:hypothetical protein
MGITMFGAAAEGRGFNPALPYPLGQIYNDGGNLVDAHFAGFQQSASWYYFTPSRAYGNSLGRWLTPDPGNAGADPWKDKRY